jgi:non-specific serine/threonine protein kinase
MPLTIGARLGPHEILDRLGAGGMGEVYLALDTRLERRVALKILPGPMSRDAEAIGRFRREGLMLASLNHPNIATIYGFEELADGTTALVMEWVDGETLSTRLGRGDIAIDEVLRIGLQIAGALEVAHEHGVIHRDVKPGNVMIGPRGLIKVLDFGLARRRAGIEPIRASAMPGASASTEDSPTLAMPAPNRASDPSVRADGITVENMTVGTPGYMSPEQVLGQEVDERTDVFALGCVLYECLTGQRVFSGDSALEVMRATLTHAPNLERLPENTPREVRALVGRSLERDRERRPSDMSAVIVELEEALGIGAAARREAEPRVIPNNLPARATRFVGREEARSECGRLLGSSRLLSLLGMGGSGKTRLALEVAEERRESYPDGLWFVNLSPVADSGRVVDVAAEVLGVTDAPGRSPLDGLVDHVGDRRMLFVVDNCETALEGARSLVAGILARCPRSRVLATSREPLALDGEALFLVPALAIPETGATVDPKALIENEAVRLFVDRARGAQPDFDLTADNAADVIEICRRLDGIPLALELAAARVRLLGVSQIRARLGDRFKLLAQPRGRGPSGQETLLATIQWSWDHLLPPEQDLARRLAVFTGGWTLERATQVTSDSGDEFEVLDLLTRLVERSVVVVERRDRAAPRYRFLESVWRFVFEKLEAHPDHAPMRERHLNAYLELGTVASKAMTGPGLAQQLAELKPEEDNILAALDWCDHAPDGARRGLLMVESFQRFWSVTGRYTLALRVLEDAIRRDAANPPNGERARVLTRAASFLMLLGRGDEARSHLEESAEFLRTSEDSSGLPAALAGLGVVAMIDLRYEDALAYGEESLELYRRRGQSRGVAMALHNLGTIESVLRRSDHGRARFETALALLRETGDRSTEALCLTALAVALVRGDDLEAARDRLRECLAILADIAAPREGLFAIDAIAEWMLAEGRPSDASRFAGASEASRRAFTISYFPSEKAEADQMLERIRASLGQVETERSLEIGRGMSLESALNEARTILGAGPPREDRPAV